MGLPLGPQRLEAAVSVGNGEGDAEEVAELPVEIGECALGAFHDADDDIADLPEL